MADFSSVKIFFNAKFFTFKLEKHAEPCFFDCMHVMGTKILYMGSRMDQKSIDAISSGASLHDLYGSLVLPGFIDGHMHLLLLGQSLQKLSLEDCQNLDDIKQKIKAYGEANPKLKRLLCCGWMHPMTNGDADSKMLEDLDERPIFIDAKDLHSTWCNEAALRELGVDSIAEPVGGIIHRNSDGKPSGLISESANISLVWPHLAKVASPEEKMVAIKSALSAYMKEGYTGICDMAMDENAWEALVNLQREEDLPIRIAAYWLITPSENIDSNLKQVNRAINLRREYNETNSPNLRIAGIKLICDGVIDACTAALLEPYSTNNSPDPLWSIEMLEPVVEYADKAGLQCALHAIGDRAIRNAIDVLEKYSTPGRRHRIEHLELCSAEDACRLGKLSITASIQPVHADPAILKAWPHLLGEQRCTRAFAYREFLDGGATLALGTDSPTAPYQAMPNIYTATTRRSAREPASNVTVNENHALSLSSAISSYTHGSAYSCFSESFTGQLEAGYSADFVVMDMKWSTDNLLKAKVKETWYCGKKLYGCSTS